MVAVPGNALNITQAGQVRFDGVATFSGDALLQYDILVGGAANAIVSVGPGSAGQVLQSGGNAANPSYSTATYPSSSGGTGKILYDNGTNFVESVPTFPAAASATARKIIVSDGTNWVASTETWAVPGTSGNVLTSNGTNWTSAAASGAGLTSVTLTLTSAQIKALHATPITIVSAPASGIILIPFLVVMRYIYGGTNAFTAAASQTVSLQYANGGVFTYVVIDTPTLAGTTTKRGWAGGLTSALSGSTDNSAQALVLINPQATEVTGNAGNNNTAEVILYYSTATY